MSQIGYTKIMSEELVFRTISKLTWQNRAILSLRYFEGMCFSEIAQVLNRSYLQICISFFLTKHFIKKELAASGFKEGFRPAIDLFGKLTKKQSGI